jgi:hypothetical protein
LPFDQTPRRLATGRHIRSKQLSSTGSVSTGEQVNSDIGILISGLIGCVPEVGSLLSGIFNVLWGASTTPNGNWTAILDDINEIIQQDITLLVISTETDILSGIAGALSDYLLVVQAQDQPLIPDAWNTALSALDVALPSFQQTGYEIVLLPLFGQFANLYLAHLRDGVQYGETAWGWNDVLYQSMLAKLEDSINNFGMYVANWYSTGLDSIQKSTKANNTDCQPFSTVNAYQRKMQLGALDYSQFWPLFDPTVTTYPVVFTPMREIFTDPIGTCTDSGPIVMQSMPSQPISSFTIWSGSNVDGVQITYPDGGGPGGVTTTARMGDQDGGAPTVFQMVGNPIVQATAVTSEIVNSVSFTFNDGTSAGPLGTNVDQGEQFTYAYDGEIVSRIHINGLNNYYGCADCIVFGFKFAVPPAPSPNTVRRMYVSSPVSATVEQLASKHAGRFDPGAMAEQAELEDWETERRQYWESVQRRRARTLKPS